MSDRASDLLFRDVLFAMNMDGDSYVECSGDVRKVLAVAVTAQRE